METAHYPSPHLKKVLRSYQSSASSSLSGPNGILAANPKESGANPPKESQSADPKPRPLFNDQFQTLKLKRHKQTAVCPPILTAPDRSWTAYSETILEGHSIACFVVGGEKRLCLPQVLNSALRQFHIAEINAVCDELHIYCSLSSPAQLEILKSTGTLPPAAASCGLITKTDAERLCSALLRRPPARLPHTSVTKAEQQQPGWFRVFHGCFGKCEGICKPELYETPISPCIECIDCGMLLSPQYFVTHAHRGLENRSCHWGFDSSAWRDYLLLARRQLRYDSLVRHLEAFKSKFATVERQHQIHVTPKRKQQVEEVLRQDGETTMMKKCKEEDDELGELQFQPMEEPHPLHPAHFYAYLYPHWPAHPLAPPYWPDPDQSYQPNVSLAPPFMDKALPIAEGPSKTSEPDWTEPEHGDGSTVNLRTELRIELQRVEELLQQGGCDPLYGKDILRSFRKLCLRLADLNEPANQMPPSKINQPLAKWNEDPVNLPVKIESEGL